VSRYEDAPTWLVRLFVAGGWVVTVAPAVALLAVVALLAGCASPAPSEGTIEAKDHRGSWVQFIPGCYGKYGPTCQVPIYHGESWRLRVCPEAPGECGWVEVPESDWDAVAVGDYWRADA
jgi:hypothetical protein